MVIFVIPFLLIFISFIAGSGHKAFLAFFLSKYSFTFLPASILRLRVSVIGLLVPFIPPTYHLLPVLRAITAYFVG